ncbi:hypothetical protein BASA81_003762 [Batrachochytrium salamandrivorans]|nr:hypothetical protein BASA81_003762 [Batrachochytrium salamandrivorans]
MCRPILADCGKVLRLFFALATGALFAASAGPSVFTLSGSTTISSSLGVSVLVAGAVPSSQSTVYWTDLDSANACQIGSAIYQQWSGPYGMCPPCRDNLNANCFQMPADTQFKIIMVFSTIGLAIILIVVQLLDFLTCGFAVLCCRPLEVVFSILLMSSATLTFPFWTTTGLQAQLVSSRGSVIPVFAANGSLVPSEIVVMGKDNGYILMCAGLASAVLAVLTLLFPATGTPDQPPQEEHVVLVAESENEKGCCAGGCCGRKKPVSQPSQAEADAAAAAAAEGGCCGRKKPVSQPAQADAEAAAAVAAEADAAAATGATAATAASMPPTTAEDAVEAQLYANKKSSSSSHFIVAPMEEMRKTHESDVSSVPVTTIGQV